jgi:hypothetical protein
MKIYKRIRMHLLDSRIVDYVTSKEWKELDREDRLVALLNKMKEYGMDLVGVDNLGQIYSALSKKLNGNAFKENIQKVRLPMKVYEIIRLNLGNDKMVKYIGSKEWGELDREDRLVALVNKMKENDMYLGGVANLGKIYTCLPRLIKGNQFKINIQIVNLPMRVYEAIRCNLEDEKILNYLQSDGWKQLDAEDRLVSLVNKMKDFGMELGGAENLAQLYTALPRTINGYPFKISIQKVDLPIRVYEAIRNNLENENIQSYIESDEWKELDAENRLVALLNKMKEFAMELGGTKNLGQLYSGLPKMINGKELKGDIQKVDLPMRVYEEIRKTLNEEEVINYINSEEWLLLPIEERLPAIVKKMHKEGLEIQKEDMETARIYTAMPATLQGKPFKCMFKKF